MSITTHGYEVKGRGAELARRISRAPSLKVVVLFGCVAMLLGCVDEGAPTAAPCERDCGAHGVCAVVQGGGPQYP